MKYQHILNNELLFETDDVSEFLSYLLNDKRAAQAKNTILFNLLDKSNGYICKMVNAKSEITYGKPFTSDDVKSGTVSFK
jgi:hypothetical protein